MVTQLYSKDKNVKGSLIFPDELECMTGIDMMRESGTIRMLASSCNDLEILSSVYEVSK
jgi:hypothetical protein